MQLVEYEIKTKGTVEVADGVAVTRNLLLGLMPEGATVEAINDLSFYGFCECCGVALCEGARRFVDEGGVYLCQKCAEELA